MAQKEECICEPLEVDAPQPLQNNILMKDIKLCIDVLNKAKDCKYRTQLLHIVREERYHLLNIINKIKAQENKGNANSSKEDLERNRFLKEMEIELERSKIIHMRKEWARQQNSLAKVQENLYKKCRLLSLHSNYASLQGHSLCSPLAVLLEKKEVVEFFLDEQDTYLISFIEIASGCLTSYVRTYAYEAPLEDSPDTGFILALYTCIAHISALPNGRQFLMGQKECQEMMCEFISDLPRLKYCSTKKIKLAQVKILHNLGKSQNGSSYLWNCEELPHTLNQLIEQEFDPKIYKLILEVFSEITRTVPDEECFNRLTSSINRERLSELTLSKYKGVNHIPKVILANVDRADKFFTNLREQQKLQDTISKHSVKEFNMADLWSDDSIKEPGTNCRHRAESYEKCTCNKPRVSQRSKSETCMWASKPASKSASSKSISIKTSCKLRKSRTSRSVGTVVSSTQKIHRESKDGKSRTSLKIKVSKSVGKSSSRVNSISTSKKTSTTGCKCVTKQSGTSQRSSKVLSNQNLKTTGSKCGKRKSSTVQRPSKGKVTLKVSSTNKNLNVPKGCKCASESQSGTSRRSSKVRTSAQLSSNDNLHDPTGTTCASQSQSDTPRRSSTRKMSAQPSGINNFNTPTSQSQSDTPRRSSSRKMSSQPSSTDNLKVPTGCTCASQTGAPRRTSSRKMSSQPSGTDNFDVPTGCICASQASAPRRTSSRKMSSQPSGTDNFDVPTGCTCASQASAPRRSSTRKTSAQPSSTDNFDVPTGCACASQASAPRRSSSRKMSTQPSDTDNFDVPTGCTCASQASAPRRSSTRKTSAQPSSTDNFKVPTGCICASQTSAPRRTSSRKMSANQIPTGCTCALESQSGSSQRNSKVKISDRASSMNNLKDQEGCNCVPKSQSATSQKHSKLKITTKISRNKGSKGSTSCPTLPQQRSSQIRKSSKKSISMESFPSNTDGCHCASKSTLNEKSSDISRRKSSYKSCNSVVSVYRNSECNLPNQNTSVIPWTADNRQVVCLSDSKQKDRAKLGPFKINNKIVIHAPNKPRKVVTRIKIKGISLADKQGSSKTPQ